MTVQWEHVMLGWVRVTPSAYPDNAEVAGSLGTVRFSGACRPSYDDLGMRDGRDRPFPGKKRPRAFESDAPSEAVKGTDDDNLRSS